MPSDAGRSTTVSSRQNVAELFLQGGRILADVAAGMGVPRDKILIESRSANASTTAACWRPPSAH